MTIGVPRGGPAPGLYRQLSNRLVLPMLLIVSLGCALAYVAVRRQADMVFDRWLLDAAVSLARQVRADPARHVTVDLPQAAEDMLAYDEVDQTFFVVEDRGRLLAGVSGIPREGGHAVAYASGRAFDAQIAGQPVRVVSVKAACAGCEGVSVRVAETVRKRVQARRRMAWLLVPAALLLAMTAAAIVLAVRRTVRSLEAIAQRWNRESHASLQPLHAGEVPRELAPFAIALNDLMSRIRDMLARERQFAAVAAHQLRTPLTALRLGLDRARAAPDLPTARAVLTELDAATRHTARMIQQLLMLGGVDPEAGRGLEKAPVDLAALAQEVCALVADTAIGRGVELELESTLADPAHPVTVQGQRELLAEALANLLDNALHATPRGGRVLVEVSDGPPTIRISDSGPGVPPEARDRIFERFSRRPGTAWEGSGLGLSIVRDIATLHDAAVSVSESALGGAAFVLRFRATAGGEGRLPDAA